MNQAVIKIDSLTIYGFSLVLVLSFLWGAFIMYKKASEAHFEDIAVLDAIILTGFWSFIFGRIIYVLMHLNIFWNNWQRVIFLKNYPGLEHWGLILGLILVTKIMSRKSIKKFFDWLDLSSLGVIASLSVFFAGVSLIQFSWQTVVVSVVSLIAFMILWKAENDYRTYDWYKNRKTEARSGFLTGVSLSFYSLIALIVGWISVPKVVWVMVLNTILFVSGLVLVYIRSGREASDDLKFILRHAKRQK